MARPIAASAAATVNMKNTNTWPVSSPRYREKAMKLKLGEQHELYAHQNQYQIAPIDEYAGDSESKKHCRDGQVMLQADHCRFSDFI